MPGLAQKNDQKISNGGAVSFNGSGSGFWSKHRDDVSYHQLQKFWSELPHQARQELLRIDKQTLFEQARKNMYCSRCNGLLLEGFWQIVSYGKSLQQEGACAQHAWAGIGSLKSQGEDDALDPSVHPWGGLTTTRDGALTLLDSYTLTKSLKGLQNVFDSARARERERELLYPDACGGSGRGWISQGGAGYGRAHGTRETCALHTARLSIDTLVDFWSALGEDTRHSLLRMKEEDFIERLMYRFDSKRFCRDCRRNVIREFKELKELKRIKREPRCNSSFCVADTAFQYEVSCDTIQVDWHQTLIDSFGSYHHFEWAVGTGEGKSDILEFENVGLSGRVEVSGLDLSGFSACYITLRAWKVDGRCSEISVKAHSMKGQQCIHCRLIVGDGYVSISRGENIKRFFEHAEEAEEEEDDDSMDKDGSDIDVECTRPQKHAKSPELAREFLLDAATVIFKEQVEKAFREGTARQNAHSIFVCLALKLLEEKVHVACKDIITLEKQTKLLEEEEKEKREEEERKERRRLKEKEKKLRRKERLREKERDKDRKASGQCVVLKEEIPSCMDDEEEESVVIDSRHSGSETEEPPPSHTTNIQDDTPINKNHAPSVIPLYAETNPGFRHPRQKPAFWKGGFRQPFSRNGGPKFGHRVNERYDFHSKPAASSTQNYKAGFRSNPATKKVWEPISTLRPSAVEKDSKSPEVSTTSPSSSDHCSSCLSEGDSSASSANLQNPESLSMSDSEDSSEEPSKKESPVSVNKPPSSSGEVLKVEPQPVPSLRNNSAQDVQFPMFQASTMGYYYPSPVSWTVPYHHHPAASHYLFPSPFAYGSPFMPYTAAFQPLPPPLFGGLPPPGHHLAVLQPAEVVKKDDRHEDTEKDGFSLFAFSDPVSVKEGTVGNFASNLSSDLKKDPVEEYNPFANGIKFSFSDIVTQPL